jgi:hypothetical protein
MTPHSSRNSSTHSQAQSQHAPLIPSNLRNSREPPPPTEETLAHHSIQADDEFQSTGDALLGTQGEIASAEIIEPEEASAYTHLLSRRRSSHAHPGPCDHGTFSPRPGTRQSSGSCSSSKLNFRDTFGGNVGELGSGSGLGRLVEARLTGGKHGKMSTTQWLAKRHGLKNTKSMYVRSVAFFY